MSYGDSLPTSHRVPSDGGIAAMAAAAALAGGIGGANGKTGRKGDPRMHRAVAARMADPKISLFDALQAGGFDYVADDDANIVDSEQITLAQRKNQLSRRVRLAKKQKASSNSCPECIDGCETSDATPVPVGKKSPKGTKRGTKRTSFSVDGGLADDPAVELSTADTLNVIESNSSSRLKAKNHPDYRPITVSRIAPAFADENAIQKMLSHNLGSPFQCALAPPPGVGPTPTGIVPTAFSLMGTTLPKCDSAAYGASTFKHVGFPQTNGTHPNSDNENPQFRQTGLGRQLSTLSVAGSANAPQNQKDAVDSLTKSAAMAGMSLEQLASSLSKGNTISNLVASSESSSSDPLQAKQEVALALYQSETRNLYQKSMLLAGYPTHIAKDEKARPFIEFALTAWQQEGDRLQGLMSLDALDGTSLQANDSASVSNTQGVPGAGVNTTCRVDDHSRHEQAIHSNVQDHSQQHNHSQNGMSVESKEDEECCLKDGRHIHRLEGKCGHKAILHQPVGGKAHIDFVVGKRVECYHDVEPVSQENASNLKIWPSSYTCEDLSCKDKCKDEVVTKTCKDHKCKSVTDPKIFDMDDIDVDGGEWNLEFANGETLLGLFKLGDTKSCSENNSVHTSTG